MSRLIAGLTRNQAETDPWARDQRLRGRTYAIPFDRVWTVALEICEGGLPRWSVLGADDRAGVIEARALTRILRSPADVRVKIGLDENGQTRVDITSVSSTRKRDLGASARRIHAFLDALDARLGAERHQILDATRRPQFTA